MNQRARAFFYLHLFQITFHVDTQGFEEQVGGGKGDWVVSSPFQQFLRFLLEVVFVLKLHVSAMLLQQVVCELFYLFLNPLLWVGAVVWTQSFLQVLFDFSVVNQPHFMYFFLHRGVPMVLDGIICSALKKLGNLSPFVSNDSVLEVEDPLLVFAPDYLLNLWVQMIMPSFSTLFSNSTR